MTTALLLNTRPKIRLVRHTRPKLSMAIVSKNPTRLSIQPGAAIASRAAANALAAEGAAAASARALATFLSTEFVVRTPTDETPNAKALDDSSTVVFDWSTPNTLIAYVPDSAIAYGKIQDVSANKILGSIAGGEVEEIPLTAAGRALLEDHSNTAQRATLGLGEVNNTSDVNKPVSIAQAAADNLRQLLSEKGQANGYAPLDAGSKVPAIYLPAYVDDVAEYANAGAFPATGESGKIYTALDTNNVYRWSGSVYAEIAASPGSTDEVTEGATNKYFTGARVRSTVLTGLATVASAVIAATDTVITALEKLQAQIAANGASIAANTAATLLRATSASPVFSGSVENQGAEVYSGVITPAALTVNTNDYNPAGLATAARLRMSATGALNLTGISAGAGGRRLVLHNIGGAAITLKDDVTSTAANRFALNGDIVLSQDQSLQIEYDGTTARWRAIGGIGGGGGGGVSDGDKGDITASGGGLTWTIDANAVTYAKMQNVTAARVLGSVAGGAVSELAAANLLSLIGASASDQEIGTSSSVAVTPGVQHRHPSAVKCWGAASVASGVPTLQASYGVSSTTDSGTGRLVWNLTTAFSSVHWAPSPASRTSAGSTLSSCVEAIGITTLQQVAFTNTNNLQDPQAWFMKGAGDQ